MSTSSKVDTPPSGPSAVQVADAELKGREPRPMLPTPQPEPTGKETLLGKQNDSRLKTY